MPSQLSLCSCIMAPKSHPQHSVSERMLVATGAQGWPELPRGPVQPPSTAGPFPRATHITWVDDGEDHITVSLLSFQPIQLLLLVTFFPLILLLLSCILERKASKNSASKVTGTARGADRARLAPFPEEGELWFSGSKASHPTWMGGTSRTLFTFFRDSGTYHSVALFVTFFAPGGEGVRESPRQQQQRFTCNWHHRGPGLATRW